MAGPLGVLSVFSAAATIEVEDIDGGPPGVLSVFLAATTTEVEDVDGGPPRRCWRQVRQRPPPKLKTLMVGLLGVLAAGPAAATTEVEDVDGRPSGGPKAPTINTKKRRRWPPERCQSWRSGSAAPTEPAPRAGR
jgi:hypothetical protein